MSRVIRRVSTGSSFLGSNTIFNGTINATPCSLDYVTVTAFTGSGLGTGYFRANLYDANNSSSEDPFIDIATGPDDSRNFTIMGDIKQALHGVFTGSGSLTATIRK